jgi:hypothetical protein
MENDELIPKKFQRKQLLKITASKLSQANEDISVAKSRKLLFVGYSAANC